VTCGCEDCPLGLLSAPSPGRVPGTRHMAWAHVTPHALSPERGARGDVGADCVSARIRAGGGGTMLARMAPTRPEDGAGSTVGWNGSTRGRGRERRWDCPTPLGTVPRASVRLLNVSRTGPRAALGETSLGLINAAWTGLGALHAIALVVPPVPFAGRFASVEFVCFACADCAPFVQTPTSLMRMRGRSNRRMPRLYLMRPNDTCRRGRRTHDKLITHTRGTIRCEPHS
jgi:hypothetical protein